MMAGIEGQLAVTLALYGASAVILLGVGFFVFALGPLKKVNRLFLFLSAALTYYILIFIGASLQTTAEAAYAWWLASIGMVSVTMASVHLLLTLLGKEHSWRWFIRATYAIGISLAVVALSEPSWLVTGVAPKLYFPYYRVPGWLYGILMTYFITFPFIVYVQLLRALFKATGIERLRYTYYALSFALGFVSGTLNSLLVFGINFDPIFGAFMGVSFIPMAFGIFSLNLLGVHVVVRRTLYYTIGIAALSALLSGLVLFNDYIVRSVPYFSFWTVPVLVSVLTVGVARFVMQQLKETDRLKYEFITVAAHKLRTPLTRIRWQIAELVTRVTDQTLKDGLVRIDVANNRLIELTNVLMEAAHTENALTYAQEPVDLRSATESSLLRFDAQIKEKNISVTSKFDPDAGKPKGDPGRIAAVVDVLVENAVVYTPSGGAIMITLQHEPRTVRFSVSDTGIGVAPEDRDRIFSSFFRTDLAKTADTEGVGIGLTVAKSIVEKHGGTIGFESPGEGKGSTFWFTLPV